MRERIKEEGRSARNLVNWNVPMNQTLSIKIEDQERKEASSNGSPSTECDSPSSSTPSYHRPKQPPKKVDIRTRYWSFMFDNLRRAVDSIYETCLSDKSIIECKEAILILENYTKDFVGLIEFLNVDAAWEKSEKPTAVAWEIRKSLGSPTKPFVSSTASPRALKFESIVETRETTPPPPTLELKEQKTVETPRKIILETTAVASVKVVPTEPFVLAKPSVQMKPPKVVEKTEETVEDDNSGWQVVERNKHRRMSPTISFDNGEFDQLLPGNQKPSGLGTSAPKPTAKRIFHAFPRNAAEIRQTKSSLAKMAYSRQYLEEQRWREQNEAQWEGRRVRPLPKKVSSLPSLSYSYGCIPNDQQLHDANFPPLAATTANTKRKFRSFQSSESLCSLASIQEDSDDLVFSSAKASVEMLTSSKKDLSQSVESNSSKGSGDLSPAVVAKTVKPRHRKKQRDLEFAYFDSLHKSKETKEVEVESPLDNSPVVLLSSEQQPDATDQTLHSLNEAEKSLAEEELNLQQEIEAEERKSIDLEAQEVQAKEEEAQVEDLMGVEKNVENSANCASVQDESRKEAEEPTSWQETVERWNAEIGFRSGLTWSEMVEMEFAELRAPGAAVQLHEKLSSPSRKRSLKDSIQKQEERQTRAEEIRLKLQEEKAARLRELSRKVDEVRAAREGVMEKKRDLLDSRMSKAEENRSQQLKAIVQKAHDEDEKVQEIAFINSLEAGNKRHDVWLRHHDSEQRLHSIHEERQRKLEEKAARETAAEQQLKERRKHLEQERLNRLAEMAERRKHRELQILEQKKEMEKGRQLQAKEKAREREERLAELKAIKQAHTDDLIQKIAHKQEKTNKRYEENLELIKLRASEMSTPRSNSSSFVSDAEPPRTPSARPYPRSKYCTVCSTLIPNEVHLESHLRGKKHTEAVKENKQMLKATDLVEPVKEDVDKSIIDAPEDKLVSTKVDKKDKNGKLGKKKRQVIRKRMQQRAQEYAESGKPLMKFVSESLNKAKLQKCLKDMTRLLESNGLDKTWLDGDIHSLERVCGEINRILIKKNVDDLECFHTLSGYAIPIQFLPLLEKPEAVVLPLRTVMNVTSILKHSTESNFKLCLDNLYSNRITSLVDILCSLMSETGKNSDKSSKKHQPDVVCTFLIDSLSAVLNEIFCRITESPEVAVSLIRRLPQGVAGFNSRICSLATYLVYGNVIDTVTRWVSTINEPPLDQKIVELVLSGVGLIVDMLNLMSLSIESPFGIRTSQNDIAQLVESLKSCNLCGVVSLIYSLMLSPAEFHAADGANRSSPPPLSDPILRVVKCGVELINATAAVNVAAVQDVLSKEGISLEFRHICSHLLAYCSRVNSTDLLHDVVLMIGYFTVANPENQSLVLFGSHPSILQQLCLFPFSYFSDPKMSRILFPSLVACVYENSLNRQTLELEMSGIILADFINEYVDEMHKKEESSQEPDSLYTADAYEFGRRFPKEKWESARDYFMNPMEEE